MPQLARAVDEGGRLVTALHNYLTGLKDVSARVAAHVAPLEPTATSDEVIAKINELIAAMETARLMHPEA